MSMSPDCSRSQALTLLTRTSSLAEGRSFDNRHDYAFEVNVLALREMIVERSNRIENAFSILFSI